jgi:hypothetical protein
MHVSAPKLRHQSKRYRQTAKQAKRPETEFLSHITSTANQLSDFSFTLLSHRYATHSFTLMGIRSITCAILRGLSGR